ncbi:glycosyltransferase family 39 protein [Candidatus Woesearchaeota archaeon]|nr:glycosyltransferase family 39 protein [Candidatus Woesearchaeota archaeon]
MPKQKKKKTSDEVEITLPDFFKKYKFKISHLILLLILIYGLYLRYYHVDYPVIGYHNWKEMHYLTEARNFARDGFFKHGFFIPSTNIFNTYVNQYGAHSDTFPLTSIITGMAFRIFGNSLKIARLISIFFSLGSVVFFYLIVKELFKNEELAIVGAMLMSLNPLLVFFGRQVQLINASLFFCLAGVYFYLGWIKDFSWKNTILFSFCTVLGIITKYSFFLFLVPMLFIFPFKKLLDRGLWKKYLAAFLIGLVISLWIPYTMFIYKQPGGDSSIEKEVTSVNLNKIFEKSFWDTMKSYAADNYSLTGVVFAVLGLLLSILIFTSKTTHAGYRFFLFYFIASIPWFVLMSFKLSGHNYHQYPILPLVVFFIAYLFVIVANSIKKFISSRSLQLIIFVIVVGIFFAILLPPSIEAKNRMFDTQFQGLDIAGEYVNQHKLPGESLMHSSHQAQGIVWHSDTMGTGGIPGNISLQEEARNANWLFIYSWDFNILNDDPRSEYIKNNYRIVQFGFYLINNNQVMPVYFLLKKGGNFNETELNEALQSKVQFKDYELTGGLRRLYYVNLE